MGSKFRMLAALRHLRKLSGIIMSGIVISKLPMEYITEKDRIYALDPTGKVVAEVTFPTAGGIATIDHTFVDPSLRGGGVAGKLVKLAADKILAEGDKIAATCSYAVAWFKRHPEYELESYGPVKCRINRAH